MNNFRNLIALLLFVGVGVCVCVMTAIGFSSVPAQNGHGAWGAVGDTDPAPTLITIISSEEFSARSSSDSKNNTMKSDGQSEQSRLAAIEVTRTEISALLADPKFNAYWYSDKYVFGTRLNAIVSTADSLSTQAGGVVMAANCSLADNEYAHDSFYDLRTYAYTLNSDYFYQTELVQVDEFFATYKNNKDSAQYWIDNSKTPLHSAVSACASSMNTLKADIVAWLAVH